MPTTTTASASVPRCCQEVSRGWDTHTEPMGAHPGCHPTPLLPLGRLVVRCLWSLQLERHLLSSAAQHPQAQWHPLAPLPGAQLLPEGHPHDDTTCQLLVCQHSGWHRHLCQPGTEGGLGERGQLGDTEPSWPLQGSFSPSYIFHSCLSRCGNLCTAERDSSTVTVPEGPTGSDKGLRRSWQGGLCLEPAPAPPQRDLAHGNQPIPPQLLSPSFCGTEGFCPRDGGPRLPGTPCTLSQAPRHRQGLGLFYVFFDLQSPHRPAFPAGLGGLGEEWGSPGV